MAREKPSRSRCMTRKAQQVCPQLRRGLLSRPLSLTRFGKGSMAAASFDTAAKPE